MMARATAHIQCRLFAPTRWLVIVAAQLARVGLVIPHPLIVAITNRSWRMRIGEGRWQRITIDNQGRIVR